MNKLPLIFLLMVCMIPIAFAQTTVNYNFTSSDEFTWLRGADKNANLGNSGTVRIGFRSDTANGLMNISKSLEGITAGQTILNYTIQVHVFAEGTVSNDIEYDNISIYPITTGWGELQATWNSFGSGSGGVNGTDYNGTHDLITSRSKYLMEPSESVSFSLDPAYIQQVYEGTTTDEGLYWRIQDGQAGEEIYMDVRSDDTDDPPYITIVYEPTAPPITPPTITIDYPSPFIKINQQTIDVNISVTNDTSINRTEYYINNTLNKTNSGLTLSDTLTLGEGTFGLLVAVWDNNGESGNDTQTFTTDTTNPFDDLSGLGLDAQVGRDFNFTVTAYNSALLFHNVTIVNDATQEQVFSQQDAIGNLSQNSIAIDFDVSAYGLGSYTIYSNETDGAFNQGGSMVNIDIVEPSIGSIQCNVLGSPFDCTTLGDGITIFAVEFACLYSENSNGIAANATVLELPSTAVSATEVYDPTDVYSINTADVTLSEDESYRVEASCFNELGLDSAQVSWTISAAAVPSGANFFTAGKWGASVLKLLLTVFIIIAAVSFYASRGGSK